jgi:hypothetical protein
MAVHVKTSLITGNGTASSAVCVIPKGLKRAATIVFSQSATQELGYPFLLLRTRHVPSGLMQHQVCHFALIVLEKLKLCVYHFQEELCF